MRLLWLLAAARLTREGRLGLPEHRWQSLFRNRYMQHRVMKTLE